jgi:hypothetical protein
MPTALEGGEGSASCPGHSLPLGKTRYPLYRGLAGPQGWSGQVQKILPPPGFDPQTVQPIASRYTDYDTWPTDGVTPPILNPDSISQYEGPIVMLQVHFRGQETERLSSNC